MKNRQKNLWLIAAIGMAVLILDSKTAVNGAYEGVELCSSVVIPSLLPFFVLSGILTSALSGTSPKLLTPIRYLCKIPPGSESLLAVGLLGGYPVGAQAIGQAYREKRLSKSDAHRLLGFCNNAGPSFIFGMGSGLFSKAHYVWLLWVLLTASAILTGMLLPASSCSTAEPGRRQSISLSEALMRALRVTAVVCGWIILFKTLLAFLHRWILWFLPGIVGVALTGLLELANGIISLRGIPEESLRFVISAVFLSSGGLCVAMQIQSVVSGLGIGLYFPGKLLQTAIVFSISAALQPILFPQTWNYALFIAGTVTAALILTVHILSKLLQKKGVAFSKNIVYNS